MKKLALALLAVSLASARVFADEPALPDPSAPAPATYYTFTLNALFSNLLYRSVNFTSTKTVHLTDEAAPAGCSTDEKTETVSNGQLYVGAIVCDGKTDCSSAADEPSCTITLLDSELAGTDGSAKNVADFITSFTVQLKQADERAGVPAGTPPQL